jgi:hypothetical protein
MNTFPELRTSAVAQYPLSSRTTYVTEVLRFTDGSEQRYSNCGQPVRRWVIRLDRLDEGELGAVRLFFRSQAGISGRFAFTDPVSGVEYPNCSFAQQSMTGELRDVGQATTALILRTNGE